MAKTTIVITLKESLLKQANITAQEMNISRSRLFSIAMKQFIEQRQNRKILKALNEVYEDGPYASEQQLLRKVKSKYRQMLEDGYS